MMLCYEFETKNDDVEYYNYEVCETETNNALRKIIYDTYFHISGLTETQREEILDGIGDFLDDLSGEASRDVENDFNDELKSRFEIQARKQYLEDRGIWEW